MGDRQNFAEFFHAEPTPVFQVSSPEAEAASLSADATKSLQVFPSFSSPPITTVLFFLKQTALWP